MPGYRGGSGHQSRPGGIWDGLRQQQGVVPERIKVDNGSEFISKALDKWPMTIRNRTSPDRENRRIMPLLNHLLATFGMNV